MLVSTVASVTILAPLFVTTTRVTYKTESVFRVNQGGVEYIAIKVRSHILHRHMQYCTQSLFLCHTHTYTNQRKAACERYYIF